MELKFDLNCRYDSRKSFYGKAQVVVQGDIVLLYSYGTYIAKVDTSKNRILEITGDYSQTTTRHLKEFLRQNDIWVDNTKDIWKKYEEHQALEA